MRDTEEEKKRSNYKKSVTFLFLSSTCNPKDIGHLVESNSLAHENFNASTGFSEIELYSK